MQVNGQTVALTVLGDDDDEADVPTANELAENGGQEAVQGPCTPRSQSPTRAEAPAEAQTEVAEQHTVEEDTAEPEAAAERMAAAVTALPPATPHGEAFAMSENPTFASGNTPDTMQLNPTFDSVPTSAPYTVYSAGTTSSSQPLPDSPGVSTEHPLGGLCVAAVGDALEVAAVGAGEHKAGTSQTPKERRAQQVTDARAALELDSRSPEGDGDAQTAAETPTAQTDCPTSGVDATPFRFTSLTTSVVNPLLARSPECPSATQEETVMSGLTMDESAEGAASVAKGVVENPTTTAKAERAAEGRRKKKGSSVPAEANGAVQTDSIMVSASIKPVAAPKSGQASKPQVTEKLAKATKSKPMAEPVHAKEASPVSTVNSQSKKGRRAQPVVAATAEVPVSIPKPKPKAAAVAAEPLLGMLIPPGALPAAPTTSTVATAVATADPTQHARGKLVEARQAASKAATTHRGASLNAASAASHSCALITVSHLHPGATIATGLRPSQCPPNELALQVLAPHGAEVNPLTIFSQW
jgi:hypothetical protein